MYHSSPGTATAMAGAAKAHNNRALFIIRTPGIAGVHDALQFVVTMQRQLPRHPKYWERGANMKVPVVAGMQQARAPAQRAALQRKKNPTSRRECWVGG